MPRKNSTTKEILLAGAEVIDAYRIIPRILLLMYGIFLYQIAEWFKGLDAPTTAHTVFVSSATGVAGIVTSAYTNSGRKWRSKE